MSERRIKLTVAYDGTDFCGWQRQDGQRTVQGELESALAKVHQHEVGITGAGRTDSGVHATGQVAGFETDIARIEAQSFVPALNAFLPRDVRVVEAVEAPARFHARFDARSRSYRYFIHCEAQPYPHELRYSWHIWQRPRLDDLNLMAAAILGERDFTTFASPRDQSESRHRRVEAASFRLEGRFLVFEIRANAFLWRMVRSLVGSMIEYDFKGYGSGHMAEVLEARDRSLAGPTAPPEGLFLTNVEY
jgi:tRNA pseudouridine38-40 synthase